MDETKLVELRQLWRKTWLEALHEFASPQFQRIWVHGHPKLVSTWVECMCGYFDDLNLDEGYGPREREGFVSARETEIVSEFHQRAQAYEAPGGNDGNDVAVLADPNWANVVHAARKAWIALKAGIETPAEREYMDTLESAWGPITEVPVGALRSSLSSLIERNDV